MGNYVHAAPGGAAGLWAVESQLQTNVIVATSRQVRLNGTGLAAVFAALNTYYGGLSGAQKTSLGVNWRCVIGPTELMVQVVPGTETTCANGLITVLGNPANGQIA